MCIRDSVRVRRRRADATDHDDGARDDRSCRERTGIATHEQQTTTHTGASVSPHGSTDDDLTTGHAARRTSQPGTDAVARIPPDTKRTTRHRDACFVTGAPEHVHPAAAHPDGKP